MTYKATADELEALLTACVDDGDEAPLRRIEELIGEDPDVLAAYVDMMSMHAMLQWRHSAESGADDQRGTTDYEHPLGASIELPPQLGKLPVTDSLPAALSPPLSVLGGTWNGSVGLFSQGLPLAYLLATLIVGVGLWTASLVPVSQSIHMAHEPAPPAPARHAPESRKDIVGRITGMVDCQWADPRTAPAGDMAVALGRRLALVSGLLEITYATGAKVVLQGPVTYDVESPIGGYLSLGKLTARVEKGAGDRGQGAEKANLKAPMSNPQSPIPNPSLSTIHYPLFTIKTPTATVTDLGTEFGVDVGRDGTNDVHVFRGKVELRMSGKADRPVQPMVLGTGQSVRLAADGRPTRPSADQGTAAAATFIRRLPGASACVDLLDVVAGGDGTGKHRRCGINPTNGADEPRFVSKVRTGDNKYWPVPGHPLIDGVFVPNGGAGAVQLDSAGHFFDGFRKTDGTTLGSVWARDAAGRPDAETQKRRHWICAMGRGDCYMPRRGGLLCLHPNAGITFNLAEIRKTRNDGEPVRFHSLVGMAGRGMADVWVFVDGQPKFQRMRLRNQDGSVPVGIIVQPADRFLTLVSTDGGNNINYDWLVFGDPVLQMAPSTEEPL